MNSQGEIKYLQRTFLPRFLPKLKQVMLSKAKCLINCQQIKFIYPTDSKLKQWNNLEFLKL